MTSTDAQPVPFSVITAARNDCNVNTVGSPALGSAIPLRADRGIQRVMFVLQTTTVGGMESHCIDLAGEYVRRGIAVLAVVPGATGFDLLEERFRAVGVGVHRMDTDARRGRVRQTEQLVRFVLGARSFHPDVVHVQTGGATGGTAIVAIARLIGAVAVITEHDVPDERPSLRVRTSRYALDRATHALIAVSRRNAGLRSSRIKPIEERFAVVLNGVPLPEVDEATQRENRVAVRAQFGIEERRVVLGSVVRLAEGKGLRDLLQAVALLSGTRSQCDLMLVGDGPLRAELEALCTTLGIADHVHFAGNQRQPGRFVDAFDAFVLAVPAGSMSIALLEAMARGVAPVITFCGPEEAVCAGETGLCAPPEDPAGLAATLAPLVQDEVLRERLGKAAAAHVRDHYSVARVADDILDIYSGAQEGRLPRRLSADAPVDARPGDRVRTRPGDLALAGRLPRGPSSSMAAMESPIQRIHIVGGPGSGKTTLAGALALHFGTTAHDLDNVALSEGTGPGFRPKRSVPSRERDIRSLSESAAWVTEGAYLWWTEPLFQRAQAIIWLDPPWSVAARRILMRHGSGYVADFAHARGFRERLRVLRYPHLVHFAGFFRWSAHYYRAAENSTLRPYDPDDMSALTRAATQRHLTRYEEKVIRLAHPDLDAAVESLATHNRLTSVRTYGAEAWRSRRATR